MPVSVRQSFACRTPHRTVVVVGERGSVTVDLLAAQHRRRTRAVAPAIAFTGYQRNEMFMTEVRHFIECLAGREAPGVPLDDGIAVLKVAVAVKDSMRTGRTVVIN